MEKEIAFLRFAFIKAWRLYSGISDFDDLPKISGHYYIRKPKIYLRRNNRTKNIGYLEIISEMPQARPSSLPEYIILMIHISYTKIFPRDYYRIATHINKRLEKTRKLDGIPHIFTYIICPKASSGVYEIVKKEYAVMRGKGANMILKIIHNPSTIINDLRNFLEKRLIKLLDKNLYRKSNYEIFARPKRLAEYMIILDSLLAHKPELADYTAQLLHRTARLPIDQLLDILYNINKSEDKKQEEIRSISRYSPYI